ncbi:MAG: hypothetical protein ACREDJ_10700 [Methylocella sp.]
MPDRESRARGRDARPGRKERGLHGAEFAVSGGHDGLKEGDLRAPAGSGGAALFRALFQGTPSAIGRESAMTIA